MKNKMPNFWFSNIAYFIKSYPKYKKLKQNYNQKLFEEYINNYTESIFKSMNITYEIIGQENLIENGTFYVSNHGSMLDSYFSYLAVKHNHSYFVAGDLEFAKKIPFVKNILKWTNCIYVNRSSLKAGMKSIKEGEKQLKAGKNLIIFAEGEVTDILTNGLEKVAKFHSGSFKAAQNVKVPVIPITIVGSSKIHNTVSLFSKMHSGHVKIIIGEPIYDFVKNEDATTKQVAEKTHEIILNTFEKNE